MDWSPYATGGAASRADSFTGLEPDFAANVYRLLQDARAAGYPLQVTSAYRSPELQATLYENAIKKYGSPQAARKWVAPPGRSQHNFGRAVDLALNDSLLRDANSPAARWVKENAQAYGVAVPMSWEPWQLEPIGARSKPYTPSASQPRISTQGAAPMDAQQAPQQRGLLGLFGSGEDDPRSPAERRRDILANLAIGLSGMSMFPNTGMINALQGGVEERREARKKAAAAEKALQSKSRTVEWLRSQGREDLAAAVASGALDGKSAASLAFQQPKDDRTALMKNYEYARQTGYTGSFSDFLRQGGGGGSVVNVGTGADESALQKELGKNLGTDVATSIKAGQQARRNIARYDVLEQLLQSAPQGGGGAFVQMASNFGLKLEGASDIEAAQALINQLVPEQRQPGSGPMSDADLALFKESLPRVINTPGGNDLILQTLRGIANYDLQAGQIAQRLASGEIDVPTYLREMGALENPIPPVIRQQAPASSMTGDDAANILLGR